MYKVFLFALVLLFNNKIASVSRRVKCLDGKFRTVCTTHVRSKKKIKNFLTDREKRLDDYLREKVFDPDIDSVKESGLFENIENSKKRNRDEIDSNRSLKKLCISNNFYSDQFFIKKESFDECFCQVKKIFDRHDKESSSFNECYEESKYSFDGYLLSFKK